MPRKSWTPLGLEATKHIQTILVDPRSADVVLVGALGDHIQANDARGVFRSTNGGRSWVKTLHLDDQTGIAKLARAHDVPDVIFASTVRHWTPPGYNVGKYRSWQFGTARMPGDSSPTRTTLWKSRDGGATWTRIPGTGLPALEGRTSLAVAMGTNAQRVYLITNTALFRSDDGGTTWRQMAADDSRIHNGQGGYSCGVYVDPGNPDLVYTINTAAYRSTDGGQTFTGIKGAPGGDDPQQLWIDPTNGSRILMGLDQGATVSLDAGATWSPWYNQSTEQLYHLSTDNSYPYWVYATQQDAGAIRTRSRGNYGAVTIFDWNSVNGWEWGSIVPDPRDPQVVYSTGTGVVKVTYPSEQHINISPGIDPATRARSSGSLPLAWAPWNQRLLLAGLNFVTGTTDAGAHWTRMSPELGIPAGMGLGRGRSHPRWTRLHRVDLGVGEERRRDLGRHHQRHDPCHAQCGAHVDRREHRRAAERAPREHLVDRGITARRGHGLRRRGVRLQRRPRAVPVPHARLRPHLGEDHRRPAGG